MYKLLLVALPAALTLSACEGERPALSTPTTTNPTSNQVSLAKAVPKETTTARLQGKEARSMQPPNASAVLYMIYQKDSDGASSHKLDDGSVAKYWTGQEFELGGKHYYVGLATESPPQLGSSKETSPQTITSATFYRNETPGGKPWVFDGAMMAMGEFPGSTAPTVMQDVPRLGAAAGKGDYLIGVPMIRFSQGVESYAYALFAFRPDRRKMAGDVWKYVGDAEFGSGNAAMCAPDDDSSCGVKRGTLKVIAKPGAYPDLLVSGIEEADIRFVYDQQKEEYQRAR